MEQITFSTEGQAVMTTRKEYDGLNRLTSVSNAPVWSFGVSFCYGYNLANQRVGVTHADGSFWVYEYDELGQVVSGRKRWSEWGAVAGQQFEYAYDRIGNRRAHQFGGDDGGLGLRESRYTVNALNQYSSRTMPGYVNVLVEASEAASVSVNAVLASRQGRYFWAEVGVDNTTGPVWLGITNVAVSAVGSGQFAVSNVTGRVFVPKTPETFRYDADGNLISDGRWNYTWDGENRLVGVESRSDTPQGSWRRVDLRLEI